MGTKADRPVRYRGPALWDPAAARLGRVAALLGLRFLAEVGLLACLAWGGWQRGDSPIVSAFLGVGMPLAAALAWGRWVAPRARHRLSDPARLGLETALFVLALVVTSGAEPRPLTTVLGGVVLAAFLVSIPARGHEPAPPPRRPGRPTTS